MDTHFAVTFFGALFAIMNPITNLPVFLTVTDGATPAQQRQVALKTALYCTIMGALFAFAGQQALNFFGISVDDFRLAGGLVVLLIGLNMLHGEKSSSHHGTDEEKESYPAVDTVAFYPLTFPILVGPGTITTLILFAHKIKTPTDMAAYIGVFAGIIALLVLVFWNAPTLSKHLTSSMRVIMSRLMGMILAAIAMAMITDGLKSLLPGLA
ncbi:MarC family protein [Phaeobacter marinintestinus]|uniref:MarC family protein n=1 Tax=Falsiphaeobacter marinintestinus TaxID=1492905 RepID=UPI0011B3EF52|nr:MarC family protein [Phaeobacter marinintestinus]